MNQVNSYAPLIEFHGITPRKVSILKKKMLIHLKDMIPEKDYNNLTFSKKACQVVGINDDPRPFIRMYSSEFALVHKVVNALKICAYEGEVEFIKITNYFDLRKKED